MYKVLLVDDERMILEGISSIVNWKEQGTMLVGTARNGIEALEFISGELPHIVITDITMPGLDGIKLIEMGKEQYPSIKWILLSGFNEFEYAQKAMRFGVKHYLLKPCNEHLISQALREVVLELEQLEEQSVYLKNVEFRIGQRSNEVKEELLKQLLNSEVITEERVYYASKILRIQKDEKVRLLLFRLESHSPIENMSVIKDRSYEIFTNRIVTHHIEKNNLFVVLKGCNDEKKLAEWITQLKKKIDTEHPITITTVISNRIEITTFPLSYQEMFTKLDECFYLGKGCIILSELPLHSTDDSELYQYNDEKLIQMLKSGYIQEAYNEIKNILKKIRRLKISPYLVKSYFIHLYLTIAKKNVYYCSEDRIKEILRIDNMEILEDFLDFFGNLFESFYSDCNSEVKYRYSEVVINLMNIVEENIEHPDLSLQWIASKKLFMNPDYLGKLFKKEVNQKFSTYVTNKRIEKAVEIIQKNKNIKVFELAEMLGFGDNPQYFSQIFKKVTGVTPSDIMKLS